MNLGKFFKIFILSIFFFPFLSPVFADEIQEGDVNQGTEYSESSNYGLHSLVGVNSEYSSSSNYGLYSGLNYYYGFVSGGSVIETDGVNNDTDIDSSSETNVIHAVWSGFYSQDTNISSYEIAVGTGITNDSARSNAFPWTNVGYVTSYDIEVKLEEGEIYYVSVRAISVDGIVSLPITSDGIGLELEEIEIELDSLVVNDEDVDFSLPLSFSDNGSGFSLRGVIENVDEVWIYIFNEDGNVVWSEKISYSVLGVFSFSGSPDLPDGRYNLQIVVVKDGREIVVYSASYIVEISEEEVLPETGEKEEPLSWFDELLNSMNLLEYKAYLLVGVSVAFLLFVLLLFFLLRRRKKTS